MSGCGATKSTNHFFFIVISLATFDTMFDIELVSLWLILKLFRSFYAVWSCKRWFKSL